MEVHTYKCDICGILKKETNKWFVGWVDPLDSITIRSFDSMDNASESRDDEVGPTVVDLCGLEHALKWAEQELAKIQERSNG